MLDGAADLLRALHQPDIRGVQGLRTHVLVELHLDAVFIGTGCLHVGQCLLNDTDIHVELRRRHRQPVTVGGLIAVLLHLYLPESLRHKPLVFSFLVSQQWVLLAVFRSIPLHCLIVVVAPLVVALVLIVDGSGGVLHAVVSHTLIDEAGGVNGHIQVFVAGKSLFHQVLSACMCLPSFMVMFAIQGIDAVDIVLDIVFVQNVVAFICCHFYYRHCGTTQQGTHRDSYWRNWDSQQAYLHFFKT